MWVYFIEIICIYLLHKFRRQSAFQKEKYILYNDSYKFHNLYLGRQLVIILFFHNLIWFLFI